MLAFAVAPFRRSEAHRALLPSVRRDPEPSLKSPSAPITRLPGGRRRGCRPRLPRGIVGAGERYNEGSVTLGACLCGAIEFEIEPPYRWLANCHCSMCRKHHGSLFSTGLGVEAEQFDWLAGENDVIHYRASPAFARPFCRHCGSTVPGLSHTPDVVLVPAGTLEDDFDMGPRAHIFVGSKSPLTTLNDSLPKFDRYPTGVKLPVVSRPPPRPTPGMTVGSCLCGAVAYEVRDEVRRAVHCHCSLCRRSRGAPYSTSLFAAPERFRWTRGADMIGSYRLSRPRTYGTDFCEQCGSLVPMPVATYGTVVIPAGSVDTLLARLPAVHIFTGSKASWDTIRDDWVQFDEFPPSEQISDYLV